MDKLNISTGDHRPHHLSGTGPHQHGTECDGQARAAHRGQHHRGAGDQRADGCRQRGRLVKNNSFTKPAIEADNTLKLMRENKR